MLEKRDTATDRILTFVSTHEAMSAEDALHDASIAFEVVPAPKEISAGCGLALRLDVALLERALTAIWAKGVHVAHILPTRPAENE